MFAITMLGKENIVTTKERWQIRINSLTHIVVKLKE